MGVVGWWLAKGKQKFKEKAKFVDIVQDGNIR